jgi:hypothetical protein
MDDRLSRSRSTPTDPARADLMPNDVDLAATQRRFLVAREQSTAQSSTHQVRSMSMLRWWHAERHRVARANPR